MRIYPAIDILNGQCVRLLRGNYHAVTVYSEHPAEIAQKWCDMGADYLHVVDLNGARSGKSVNADVIREILKVGLPIQVGGGIRTMETVDALLGSGVTRVILGTAAIRNPDFALEAARRYPGRIVCGIDAKNGVAMIDGWENSSGIPAIMLAKRMAAVGTVIYTDIETDGTLRGPNVAAMRAMAQKSGLDVIASGGIGTKEHILSLRDTGVSGVIVGKALYEKTVDLKELIDELKEGTAK